MHGRPSPERLLEHAPFVRALARDLLHDAHAAEDVVQEAMAAALRRPPQQRTKLRPWLGAVGRNLSLSRLRTEARRARRERAAARPEATPSVAESVARVELHKKVVDEVLALEEPYRSSITMRYFDDLGPKEIARRLGIPVRTVKTRLQRALERLRARLDRLHGGDRAAWGLALLPLAGVELESGGAGVLTAGALAMKKKLAIAAALVGVAATLVFTWDATREPARSPDRTTAHATASADRGGDPDVGGGAEETATQEGRTTRKAGPGAGKSRSSRFAQDAVVPEFERKKPSVHRLAEATAPDRAGVRVLVVDEHGGPVPDARVYIVISRNNVGMGGGDGTTDAAGQVLFPHLDVEEFLAAGVSVGGFSRSVNAGVLGFDLVEGRVTEILIVVPSGVAVEGSVRHIEKGPLERASVTLSRTEGAYSDSVYGYTDAAGDYRMDRVPAGTYHVGLSHDSLVSNERRQGTLAVKAPGPVRKEFVLGGLSLHGFVLDAGTKRPVVGAHVSVYQPYASAETDAHGRYHFTGLPAGKYSVSVTKDGYGTGHAYRVEVNPDLPQRRDFALETAAVVQIDLVDTDGRPVSGQLTFDVKGGKDGGFRTTVTPDGAGRVRYTRLLPGSYRFTFSRAGWRAASQQVEVKPGENSVRFELERTRPPRVSLQGTVRDATTGKPVAGARIWIQSGWRHSFSDAQGRYSFEDLPAGQWQLRVGRDGFGDVDRQDVTIERDKATTMDVALQPAATMIVRVLDWEGRAVRGKVLLYFSPLERGRKASAQVEADPDGKLAYHRVLPGRYRLSVSLPRRGRARVEVEVVAGENFAEVRLERAQ